MTQGGGRKLVSVGNYRFTGKRLGKGNFARVDEAVHTVLNVKVKSFVLFIPGNLIAIALETSKLENNRTIQAMKIQNQVVAKEFFVCCLKWGKEVIRAFEY